MFYATLNTRDDQGYRDHAVIAFDTRAQRDAFVAADPEKNAFGDSENRRPILRATARRTIHDAEAQDGLYEGFTRVCGNCYTKNSALCAAWDAISWQSWMRREGRYPLGASEDTVEL